jgi:hypothetical protein
VKIIFIYSSFISKEEWCKKRKKQWISKKHLEWFFFTFTHFERKLLKIWNFGIFWRRFKFPEKGTLNKFGWLEETLKRTKDEISRWFDKFIGSKLQ